MSDQEHKPLPLWECGLALSSALAVFGAYGWLHESGVFHGRITAESAGFILLAALSLVVQFAANMAAAAARRARSYGLVQSFRWSVGLMFCGAAYNAFSLHHAWEVTGLIAPDADEIFSGLLILMSLVLAGFEPALYWIDEALKGEAATRRAASTASTFSPSRVEESADRRQDGQVVAMPATRPRRSRNLVEGAATALAVAAAVGGVSYGQSEAGPPAFTQSNPAAAPGASKGVRRPADAAARHQAETRAIELLLDGWIVGRPLERVTGLHRDTLRRIETRIRRTEMA